MKKFTLTLIALMLACGVASAQAAPNSWLGGEGSIAGDGSLAIPAPQPPAWVLERWTRDIVRISNELVTSAEVQCASPQAKQQIQRARLMAESMRDHERTPIGEFSDATLRMTSVVNNVRLALDACQP